MPSKPQIKPIDLLSIDFNAELSRRRHLDYIRYTWQRKDKYLEGQHIIEICKRIDKAFADYRKGKSSFLIFTCPFRHGKSDIVSRYLPSHFLGEFPNEDILVASYSEEFALELSRFSRRILESAEFRRIYDLKLEHGSSSLKSWKPADTTGGTQWSGIGGSITGRGYSLGIIDDYLKNREDAESFKMRDKQWEWFTNVFLTRRSPVSITIMIATRWHVDDLIGRILDITNPTHPKFDRTFPDFKYVNYKAISDDGKYLFPERFSAEWYESQKGALQSYGFQSLMQGEPVARGGNYFKIDHIKVIDHCPSDLAYVMSWDLASTEKEISKPDPDYTAGVIVGVRMHYHPAYPDIRKYQVYIRNVIRGQWKSTERDKRIKDCALIYHVPFVIESVAGYKDTMTNIEDALKGVTVVRSIRPEGDKVSRAGIIEPEIEAGEFYIEKADWNGEFLEELRNFPNGNHDDMYDAVVNGVKHLKEGQRQILGQVRARGKDEKVDYYKT